MYDDARFPFLRWLYTAGQGVIELLYPSACAACGSALERQASRARAAQIPLCGRCWQALPVVGTNVCVRCGMPQGPHVGTVKRCVACPSDLGGIHETVALGRYQPALETLATEETNEEHASAGTPEASDAEPHGPLEHPSEAGNEEDYPAQGDDENAGHGDDDDDNENSLAPELLRAMVLKLKYRRGLESARVLGALLATETASRDWAADLDWVVPVPLHWRRQLERRYNQADLIAGELAKRLGLLKMPLLVRTRYTVSQTTLPRHARASNVADAFGVVGPARRWLLGCGSFEQRRVLLVDDLFTTGATLRNAARTLKQAGIPAVYAAVVARA